MKFFALFLLAVVSLPACVAHATTIKDFESQPAGTQASLVSGFIAAMATHLDATNPQLAGAVREYFTPKDGTISAGIERLGVEMTALDNLARQGRADLSKIQVEGVIVTLVKQRFQK